MKKIKSEQYLVKVISLQSDNKLRIVDRCYTIRQNIQLDIHVHIHHSTSFPPFDIHLLATKEPDIHHQC
jgi:hypothetical protein